MKYQYKGVNPILIVVDDEFKTLNSGEIVELDESLGPEFVLVTPPPAKPVVKPQPKVKLAAPELPKKKSKPKSEE